MGGNGSCCSAGNNVDSDIRGHDDTIRMPGADSRFLADNVPDLPRSPDQSRSGFCCAKTNLHEPELRRKLGSDSPREMTPVSFRDTSLTLTPSAENPSRDLSPESIAEPAKSPRTDPGPLVPMYPNGHDHSDTKGFNDLLAVAHLAPNRYFLSKVRIWSQDYVYGLSVTYSVDGEEIQQLEHVQETEGLTLTALILGDHERVTKVTGRCTGIIHNLTIHTTTRKMSFGTSPAGTPFTMEVPHGHTLVGLYGGYGAHLHNLGIITRVVGKPGAHVADPISPLWAAARPALPGTGEELILVIADQKLRARHSRFGAMTVHEDSELRITEIESSGFLSEWNTYHPEREVRVGDSIIAVDHVCGSSHDLRNALVLDGSIAKDLVITLVRKAFTKAGARVHATLATRMSPEDDEQLAVIVEKGNAAKLGAKIIQLGELGLQITVLEKQGTLSDWNDRHRDALIRPGDRIIAVGGVFMNSEKLKDSLASEEAPELLLVRNYDPHTGGLEFTVMLDRSTTRGCDAKLGATVAYLGDHTGIEITGLQTVGLLQSWNRDHPDLQVHKGDRIVSVNGHRGSDQTLMREALVHDLNLRLAVVSSHMKKPSVHHS